MYSWSGLVVGVEKSETTDVSSYGLNGVNASSYSAPDIIRANVNQKNVEFFALSEGTTAFTATDANNKTVFINATVALSNSANTKSNIKQPLQKQINIRIIT